jgi:uncharacterized protein (TIGR03437 family)
LFGILDGSGLAVSAGQPVLPLQPLALLATGLGVAAASADGVPAGLAVLINGQRSTPSSVTPVEGASGLYRVSFEVPLTLTATQAEVALQVSGKRSNTLPLVIGVPDVGVPGVGGLTRGGFPAAL